MLNSVLGQVLNINSALAMYKTQNPASPTPGPLSPEFQTTANDLLEILTKVRSLTLQVQARETSIGFVIPFYNFMKRLCMTFQHSVTCSGVVAYFAVNIWKEFEACINRRYRKPEPHADEWKDHYIIAALLSPNTRYSVSQTNEYESYKQVFRSSLVLPDVPATHSTLPIRRRRTFEPISLAAVLGSSFAAVLPEYTEAPLDESIHAFLDLFITDKNQSGLSWWADNYRRFPALSIIARQYLAISAANAEVERLFSTSATIMTEMKKPPKSLYLQK